MLYALISLNENGRICEIREEGKLFDVNPDGFKWISLIDDSIGTTTHRFDVDKNMFVEFQKDSSVKMRLNVARAIEYGTIGDQLDMIWKELNETGTLSKNGEWFNHVKRVKDNVTRDNV